MYVEGRGVKADIGRATELLRAAAAENQPVALLNLALMHLRGDLPARDGEAPADLLARSAEQGNVEAQYALASYYADDKNPARDPVAAAKWMREAAMAGFEAAEIEFGLMLANGKGVKKNIGDAFIWIRRSALRGNAIGRNRLARMYAVGLGVAADPIEAWKWHSLAKRQGLPDLWLETRLAGMSDADRKRAEAYADVIAGTALPAPPRPATTGGETPPASTAAPPRR
jgi:TPR repeat protein